MSSLLVLWLRLTSAHLSYYNAEDKTEINVMGSKNYSQTVISDYLAEEAKYR